VDFSEVVVGLGVVLGQDGADGDVGVLGGVLQIDGAGEAQLGEVVRFGLGSEEMGGGVLVGVDLQTGGVDIAVAAVAVFAELSFGGGRAGHSKWIILL
jgi:hypothetical protein